MTVTVGIWLGHERHGFDYSDEAQLADQREQARQLVLRYRDHPALLAWGIGNEMEGFGDGDDPAIWAEVNRVAALVKELDPHHPTMTVTTFVHGQRIEFVHRRSPAIDIHGINAYAAAGQVPALLRAGGATKPFVLTEFGPPGPWETPRTAWGAPHEPTSDAKARFYRETYETAILGAAGMALGSYAFLWGHKMEGTETWFGMFLADGARTAAVDVMTELWSGRRPAERAPVVGPLQAEGEAESLAGCRTARPRRCGRSRRGRAPAPLGAAPRVRRVSDRRRRRRSLPEIEGVVLESGPDGAQAADARGAGALSRVPVRPRRIRPGRYSQPAGAGQGTGEAPHAGSRVRGRTRGHALGALGLDGWREHLTLEGDHTEVVQAGTAAVRIRYEGRFGWAGIAWQDPPNNWGDQEGGRDLRGASALELWARGEYGGEQVSFGVGLIGSEHAFPDSGIAKVDGIALTREWRRYRVPLKGLDLSAIRTGFVVTLTGRATPVTVYLDSIRFVR
jgi:hypothetical protein